MTRPLLAVTLALLPALAFARPAAAGQEGAAQAAPPRAGAAAGAPAARPATAYQSAPDPLPGEPVVGIDITSSYAPLVQTAHAAIVQPLGEPPSVDALQRSLQNLYALGTVADVRVTAAPAPGGVRLRFALEPLMRLYEVRFEGDSGTSKRRLRRALPVSEGQPLDARAAADAAAAVQQALADDGFLLAQVSAETAPLDPPTRGLLRLRIEAGSRTRLEGIRLEGETGLPPAQLRPALGLAAGDVYRPGDLRAGLERIDRMLVQHGYFYRSLRVTEQSLDLSANGMAVTVAVQAGPRVQFDLAGLDWSRQRVQQLLPVYEFGSVEEWALKETRQRIVRLLQEDGYWRPLVSYARKRDAQGRNVAVQMRVLAGRRAALTRIAFEGNRSIGDATLRAAIRSRESRLLDPRRFISEWWQEDADAVLTVYRRRGYASARILEAPVRYDAAAGGVVAVMRIDEGPQTRVADVRVTLAADGPAPGLDADRLRAELELRPGGPFDPGAVRRDAGRLRALLANLGYPRALIDSEVQQPEAATDGPVVVHQIVPGRRARVARLLVAGNDSTDEEVIRRELAIVPGSPFAFADVLESQSRLYRTGLFTQVEVRSALPDDVQPDRDVVVRVQEAAPMFVSYGLGFDTEERLRGLFAFGHNNLFGRNVEATLSVRASLREQRFRVVLHEPYFAGRRLEGTASAFYSDENRPSFDVRRIGGSLQLLGFHSRTVSSLARLSFRDVETFNIDIDPARIERQDQSTRVGSIGYTLVVDTRRDLINPRSGSYHTFDIDVATRALRSGTSFVAFFGRSFVYRELRPGVVLATALRTGVKLPFAGTETVPLPERFFAGGATSFRGLPLDDAGPRDDAGNALGGELLLLANLELRLPVRDALGAVLFLDVGNVFAKPRDLSLAGLRRAAGIGLRYATAVGPIRVDVARLLDRRPGESRYHLFFSLGHTF